MSSGNGYHHAASSYDAATTSRDGQRHQQDPYRMHHQPHGPFAVERQALQPSNPYTTAGPPPLSANFASSSSQQPSPLYSPEYEQQAYMRSLHSHQQPANGHGHGPYSTTPGHHRNAPYAAPEYGHPSAMYHPSQPLPPPALGSRIDSYSSNSMARDSASPPSKESSPARRGSAGPGPSPASAAKSTVVRAACLSCRTAKRRCDGGQPVCGPCVSRGITADSGKCEYVASKRGGPRFKGCTGEEAKKIKADKEQRKMLGASRFAQGSSNGSASRNPHKEALISSSRRPGHAFDGQGAADRIRTPADTMASNDRSAPSVGTPQTSSSENNKTAEESFALSSRSSYSSTKPSSLAPLQQPQKPSTSGTAHPHPGHDALSSANLEMLQKMQQQAASADSKNAGDGPGETFYDFFSRLEHLPKAGHPSKVEDCPMEIVDDTGAESLLLNAADSEQQARFLLTHFFEKVYPSAPALLAPENLSSLAFWFSGKGPCALYAAIGALVTLRLPERDAHKTLRGGHHHPLELEGLKSRADIAAHHARTSEFLLRRFQQQQAAQQSASHGLDPSALSGKGCDDEGRTLCQGSGDPELLRIEAAAAHTLLAHYFYGAGGHTGQRQAHEHALLAWNSLQGIRIDLLEGAAPRDPLSTSYFSWEQKQEWAKRVYWTSFAAASVTAATGGFHPLHFTVDAVTALKLRPSLESDVGAWGVFIRGAQHVARGYCALYDFEMLKTQKDLSSEALAAEKARIYSEFSRLDKDMTSFSTYDPAWRYPPEDSDGVKTSEQGLVFALRTAGKLMTAGATIIIHRGQAYANANIFMEAQCGLPEASRVPRTEGPTQAAIAAPQATTGEKRPRRVSHGDGTQDVAMSNGPRPSSPSDQYVPPGRLWHRSGSISLPPAGSSSSTATEQQQAHQQQQQQQSQSVATCKPGGFDPHVAILDANFINDSSWNAGSGSPWHHHSHEGNGGTPGQDGPRSGRNSANTGSIQQDATTATAMAAYQAFQAQQGGNLGGGESDSHSGAPTTSGTARGLPLDSNPESGAVLNSERYQFGPFEPEYSLGKCRWAATAMLESVPGVLRGSTDSSNGDDTRPSFEEAPSLPPWAACSYVLAGYALLMQCLIVQASRAWRHDEAHAADHPGAWSNGGEGDELDFELKEVRGKVQSIQDVLGRFALTFSIAKEYRQEVVTLLEINKRLP